MRWSEPLTGVKIHFSMTSILKLAAELGLVQRSLSSSSLATASAFFTEQNEQATSALRSPT
jgi:hypothetical protein